MLWTCMDRLICHDFDMSDGPNVEQSTIVLEKSSTEKSSTQVKPD
jgi:hypothetical protein